MSSDYSGYTVSKLIEECKKKNIRGYTGKKKQDLLELLTKEIKEEPIQEIKEEIKEELIQEVINDDCLNVFSRLKDNSAQIVIADPPYNIGKDFGNNSDKQDMNTYLEWCDKWIKECLRILKDNGTMFIYGFSENLALICSRIPENINRRWIIWHYTNKNVASLNFWQRSHESILLLWKNDKVFNKDDVREAYTEGFLNGSAGKERTNTKGRFSKGDKTTTYTAHPNGALPRDVIKIAALAGGAGMKERVDHPTQKPLALCEKLLKSCKQSSGYVLIPFAGSGSECVAAKLLNMSFIGIEINKTYIDIINDRLKVN
jgi:site-specific DNA-methyltransferase (adenine-specific)